MVSFKLLLAFAIVGAVFAAPADENNDDGRILNGRAAKANAYPYQVSVQRVKIEVTPTAKKISSSKFCGGVLLDQNFVLTAAHCFDDDSSTTDLNVHAGNTDAFNINGPTSQLLPIKRIFIHPGWHAAGPKSMVDDLALLQLATPAKFNQAVQPIYLPPPGYVAAGTGKIIGWGAINTDETVSSRDLLEAEIDVSPISACSRFWRMEGEQLCLGANSVTNACGGDSGGPFIQTINGKTSVVGITSFGAVGCRSNEPIVYTKVTSYLPWILATRKSA